ncbi:putative LRR protein [Phytophthora megakarya]|uniref:Putative LRR protein n=1 Tax=Phytophthora megakarya TaxID=4795 RepID=A0A225VY45_9STRA|nr:putative LRR protein [Phytophthora megakarya]
MVTDPVSLGRSPAEVSTINSLRSLPDLLLYSGRPQSAKCDDVNDRGRNITSSVTTLRTLCCVQGRRQSITNTLPHTEFGSLERWLTLAEVFAKLDDDALNLEREIQVHEHKRIALNRSNAMKLPPVEAGELGPKLQCLQEVLSTSRFRAYCRDLWVLVRNLRLRLDLYGTRMLDFERHLCREPLVPTEKLLWLLNEAERRLRLDLYGTRMLDFERHLCREPLVPSEKLLQLLNEAERGLPKLDKVNRLGSTISPTENLPPIEYADYALLFQHCSDPVTSDTSVVTEDFVTLLRITEDFVTLLRSLPLERETLLRYVFEQLADSHRGEGHCPPPDYTRIHHLYAATRLQRKHCSPEETEAVEAWLDVVGSKAITLQDLFQFHVPVSDANVSEDAEFVRFVQRMWGFDHLAVTDADRGEAIQHLLEGYTAKCNLHELMTRKLELLVKIPRAQARIQSVSALIESELQHLRVLQAPTGLVRWLQSDESINARLGCTLVQLRELTLSGQILTAIPDFVASLQELQILDLHDNRLATISSKLGTMKTIRRLNLSDNLLHDASFAQTDEMWSQLEVLSELSLSGNKLTSLPSALVAIPFLNTLDLSRNSLRIIRGEVVKLWKGRSYLSTLDLHANSLTALPEEIQVLFGALRRLFLHQNYLASLPSTISELIKLEELTLSQNQLARTQKTLNNSLTRVDVRGNRLRSVVDWTPLVLANCQALHLQNNSLRELPQGFFATFPSLRICELQNNQLRLLPMGITECTRLQILHVNNNCLQSVPGVLVELPFLEVLNVTENELTEIPLEWHAFETQSDGGRVLHSLMLRRNPLRNKVLMNIVDGSTDGSPFSASVASDDVVCEGVIKKLLDGLREASFMLRDTRMVRVSTRKAWTESDEDDERPESASTKPKWRGIARDVNNYLEQRIRAMQQPKSGRNSSLIVDVKSFERLIRSLPFTCSKRELTYLVRRFLALGNPDDEVVKRRYIDGLAFLQAIERFGRWRSIATPSKRPIRSIPKPTIDTAGPIIRYLEVLYRRMLQEQEDKYEPQIVQNGCDEIQRYSTPSKPRFKIKVRTKRMAKTPRPHIKDSSTEKRRPTHTRNQVPEQFIKFNKCRADVIADRQRQRIQVLEQQLVDQKLLLLAPQNPQLGKSKRTDTNNGSAIVPTEVGTMSDHESRDTGTCDHILAISVKCLHLRGPEENDVKCLHLRGPDENELNGEQAEPARLEFYLKPDDSVQYLKQQLEARIGVSIDQQILVANSVGRGVPSMRLRNNGMLREYSQYVGGTSRWSLTLLIGQSLPLLSGLPHDV